MMEWTIESEARLTELRQRELSGTLNKVEEAELAVLMAAIETDEAAQLASSFTRISSEQAFMQSRLRTLQTDNEALASLLNQQERLVADAQKWLIDLEQRHTLIRQSYTRITGETLVQR